MTESNSPTRLQTAYAADPIGIDEQEPALRWRVPTDRAGASQSAFRVLVASTTDCLADDEGDVWDTGKRVSDRPAVRYDGPALESGERYHWKVRVWDENDDASAWSDAARWEMALLDDGDWSASWIRRTDEFERGEFSYVRNEVTLQEDIERARAYVSASHQYALSINGETVDRGQSFCYPDFQYYKTVDVTDALTDGQNAVGALYNWNAGGQGRPAAEPGFVLQLAVEYADGREQTFATDGDWTAREAEWLDSDIRNGEIAEPIEVIDGRDVPFGWDEPGFDDDDWVSVAVVGEHPTGVWERLIAQDREVVRHRIDAESIEQVDDDSYVVDFGRVYTGVPVVEFQDGDAGHRVDLLSGYLRTDDGTVDDTEGTQWTDMSYGYVQRDGTQRFRPFNYLGFRYLQITDPGEVLDIDQVWMIGSYNEVPDERAATFECDDDTVEDVFELARHSALYGSQEQFIDTPTREKGQFLMDAFNVSEVTTNAFGERRLSRQAFREFVQSHYRYWAPEGRFNAVYPNDDGKRDIPDFTVAFPEWLARFYETTDDLGTLELAYPVVRAVADYVVENLDEDLGLVTRLEGGEGGPYHEGIVDWPPEMRYGYDRDWPARTTVNVLCANALDRAAEFADELGRPDAERAYYASNRDAIEAGINERLLEGDRYVDGCDADDASDHVSQHANALPLATGIVPDDVADDVADRIVDDGMRMGPMMVRWLLDAFDVEDRPAAMVDLLTDRERDGWANILEQDGSFTWETWHCRSLEPDDERRNRSTSHAMGATVLASIQRTLLGVHVTAPGAATIEISPPADGLDEASGRVPTERGPVEVGWERDGEDFALDVTVPWNATATVRLPTDGTPERVAAGEHVVFGTDGPSNDLPDGVRSVSETDDGVAVEVGAGSYGFELGH